MATVTPNFLFPVPQSTDLVKDGATAIAALGTSIDTQFVDLKGGTTGQVLAKASATDLDYSWTTPQVGDITAVTAGTGISGGGTSGAVTITNSMATEIAAKGDLIVGTGSQTFDNLTAGSNFAFLQANSATATGLQWNNAAWTAFAPVATAASGTITSYFSDGTYTRIGKLCVFRFFVNIANKGTATAAMYLTLPFTAAGIAAGIARDVAVNGFVSSLTTGYRNSTQMDLNIYDNTTPFVNGVYIVGTISYEVA